MTPSIQSANESLLVEQAKAIGLILDTALSSSVALFDVESGRQLLMAKKGGAQESADNLPPATVKTYATLLRPLITVAGPQRYQAVLPIKATGGIRLLALTSLARFAVNEPETKQEIHRLETLCALLLHRISSSSGKTLKTGEAKSSESQVCSVLTAYDVLFRNARLHGDSTRFQRHALKAISEVVGAELALWVMGDKATARVNKGGASLSSWDCQQLAGLLEERSDWDNTDALIDNNVGQCPIGCKFSQIRQFLAVRVRADGMTGYVVAINKCGAGTGPIVESNARGTSITSKHEAGFHRGDAGLLSSFSALVAAQARTSRRYGELKEMIVGLTRALTAAIDAKDGYTAGHSERVGRMAVELGKELGLAEEQLNDIYLAGLLHDVGKIGIRDEVLGKKGPLTDAEHDHIKQHVIIGHRILAGLTGIENLIGGVRHHHEQYNGRGYPDGLAGENIPRLARILAVADSFDAMSSDRPYREGMPMEKVEKIFREGRGEQWDPVIVDAFFRAKERLREVRQRGIGESLREALDGVIRQDPVDDNASLVFGTP